MDTNMIHQYENMHKIGESVLSVIYKAFDSEKQIQVLVKQLKPSDSIKRDLPKIKRYIDIKNKNLCTVLAVEQNEKSTQIVSEYLEGTPLQKYLKQEEFSQESLLKLLLQITNGLSALHRENLHHGNLKLSNIIIKNDGQAVLTDFGLSPFENFQNSPEFIAPYEAYHFLAPEQVQNNPVTFQTDFFALGVIAYRILIGKLPFEGQNEDKLSQAIIEYSPDYSEIGDSSNDKAVSLLLTKLLAKNPKDRFVDTSELKATLEEIMLIHTNSKRPLVEEEAQKNPRNYLILSVLIFIVPTLWIIAYLAS